MGVQNVHYFPVEITAQQVLDQVFRVEKEEVMEEQEVVLCVTKAEVVGVDVRHIRIDLVEQAPTINLEGTDLDVQ